MPRNGAGVASHPAGTDDFVSGTVIESSKIDLVLADIYSIFNTAWPVSLGGTGLTVAAPFPTVTVDNTVPRWDGTAGKFQTSGIVIDDSNNLQTGNGTALLPSHTFISDPDSGMYRIGADNIGFAVAGALELDLNGTRLQPGANDGLALGSLTVGFSDLFLASGAVLNIANSNWVATHTSGILTVGTGDLRVTTAGTNSASVVTVGGTQTLTGKTLTSPVINTGIELGDASDTTLTRVSAGVMAVEGNTVAMLATANVFTAAQTISNTAPSLVLNETDAAANNGRWYIQASNEALRIFGINDAENASGSVLIVNRTGTTIDDITWGGTTIKVPDGSAAAPSIQMTGAAHGIFRAGGLGIAVTGAEVARFTDTILAIGVTTAFSLASGTTDGAYIELAGRFTASIASNSAMGLRRRSSDGAIVAFNRDTTTVGTISVTTSATAYNTSSDERLKEFIGVYDPVKAIAIILADPVRDFHWIKERGGAYAVGWGAQTSFKVSADLATPPANDDEWWGVDQGKRTPYLWAATTHILGVLDTLQAANTNIVNRLDILEARVNDLEKAA